MIDLKNLKFISQRRKLFEYLSTYNKEEWLKNKKQLKRSPHKLNKVGNLTFEYNEQFSISQNIFQDLKVQKLKITT